MRYGWLVTGPMAALLLLSAIPDILRMPDALTVFTRLGYPPYLLLFLGTAKTPGGSYVAYRVRATRTPIAS